MRSTRAQAIKQIQGFAASPKAAAAAKATSSASTSTPRKKTLTSKYFRTASAPPSESELSSAPSEDDSDVSVFNEGSDAESNASQDFDAEATPELESTATPRKRKRGENGVKAPAQTGRTINDKTPIKSEGASKVKKETVSRPKIKREGGKIVEYTPPGDWEEMYDAIKEMRLRIPAAVDTVGCERLAQLESDVITPKINRFQTLIALMLSSQTKDTVTGATIMALQRDLPGGLTLDSILAVDPVELDRRIGSVGFHNRKTEYIKKTAIILRDKFDGDIPRTVDDMISLPGVGPKMAHLLSSAAWNDTQGIGVDTHVHRLCQMFKWVPPTQSPEHTRLILETWLPKDKWREINWLLVGFGQTICLPRGRRCWECTMGPKKTGGSGLCRASLNVTGPVKYGKTEIKEEEENVKYEGEEGESTGKVKVEVHEEEIKFEDPLEIEGKGEIIIKEEVKTEEGAIQDIEDMAGRVKMRSRKKVTVKQKAP